VKAALIVLCAVLLSGCQSLLGKEVACVRILDYSGGMVGAFSGGGIAVHECGPNKIKAHVTITYVRAGATVKIDTRPKDNGVAP
jgi:hypothetical protein